MDPPFLGDMESDRYRDGTPVIHTIRSLTLGSRVIGLCGLFNARSIKWGEEIQRVVQKQSFGETCRFSAPGTDLTPHDLSSCEIAERDRPPIGNDKCVRLPLWLLAAFNPFALLAIALALSGSVTWSRSPAQTGEPTSDPDSHAGDGFATIEC